MKIKVLIFAFLTVLLSSCIEADNIADVTDGKEYELYDYYVDEHGNGGIVIVAYNKRTFGRTLKYTIVMSLDEADLSWGRMGETLSAPDTSYSYDGYCLLMNQRAHFKGIENYPAFEWCYRKNRSRKLPNINSWILPNQKEYRTTYTHVLSTSYELINQHIVKYGGTPLDPDKPYWLAEENRFPDMVERRKDNANYFFISEGVQYADTAKNSVLGVRAVKYIYFENTR